MNRFYWIIDQQLAGCCRPGVLQASAERDLAWLSERGIRALLTLTERPLDWESLDRYDLTYRHIPVTDFQAPTTHQMLEALSFIDQAIAENRAVAVHCMAGQGRTGTVLAAYLLRGGQSATEAITTLRAVCPGAIESPPQVRALHDWANERPWMI
jgi:atypical dual specificity phosphatase